MKVKAKKKTINRKQQVSENLEENWKEGRIKLKK